MKRLKKYNIDENTYDSLVYKYANHCGICNKEDANLRVDHDHTTGKVRGLLCHNCNTGLGHFKDSILTLTKAIEYLNAY